MSDLDNPPSVQLLRDHATTLHDSQDAIERAIERTYQAAAVYCRARDRGGTSDAKPILLAVGGLHSLLDFAREQLRDLERALDEAESPDGRRSRGG